MLEKTFPLVVGARIQVPLDFIAHYNYERAKKFDPKRKGDQPMVARLVFVEVGAEGWFYGFKKKLLLSEGGEQPSWILFVPPLVGGETLEIQWVDNGCACAKEVSPV